MSSRPTTSREQFGVGAAAEGGVEVHQVDPFGALLLPVEGRLQRGAVACLAAGFALDQADGLAVDDVDGGQQFKYGQRGFGGHRGVLSFGGAAVGQERLRRPSGRPGRVSR